MDIDRRPDILSRLPASYLPIFDRLIEVTESDERIRALWLSGSLAKGTADGGSDLDVVLALRDEDFDDFAATWRDWLATITPTLIAKELPFAKGCFYSTAVGCERLDVISERASEVAETNHRYRRVVFDRDGLAAKVPAPKEIPGPDAEKLSTMLGEFLRIQAITPFMVNERRDYLCAQTGVQTLQKMLYDVFVEANQPLPPMGVKQYTAKLTAEQVEVLSALPPAAATRESLVPAMRAAVEAFRTHGRRAAEAAGATWPVELDEGVQRFFDAAFSPDPSAP